MEIVSRKIYEEIQKDIPEMEQQMNSVSVVGSKALWNRMYAKYSMIVPEVTKRVKIGSKFITTGFEYDYRPELAQLKEMLIAYLLINEVEEQTNEFIQNDAKQLMNKQNQVQEDTTINEIILESKLYMDSGDSRKKQIALEKIWDAFERLKTVYEEDGSKRVKIQNLINNISYESEVNKDMLNKEFLELTSIGNNYQIRHFEKGKEKIPSDSFCEYLYFRVLSLISYCIQESNLDT